jgi:hypothetical protein
MPSYDCGSSPIHALPPSTASKHDRRHTGTLRKRVNLSEEGGGRGAKSHNGDKAWFSISQSILSDTPRLRGQKNIYLSQSPHFDSPFFPLA